MPSVKVTTAKNNLRIQFHGANNKIEVLRSKSFIPPPSFKGNAISTTRRGGGGRIAYPNIGSKCQLQIIDRNDDPTRFILFIAIFIESVSERRVHLFQPIDPSSFPQRNTERSRLISRGIMFSDCHESISDRPPATFLIPPPSLLARRSEPQLFIS